MQPTKANDKALKVIENMSNEELRQEIEMLAPMIGNQQVFNRRWTMIMELGARARLERNRDGSNKR
jgi:hypothetical protein